MTPSILMSSMLNLYPKKYKPDLIFIGLFLCQLPQTVRNHLLALDIEDPYELAKKADALFQSHQASSLNFLTDNSTTQIYAFRPRKPRIHLYSNSSMSHYTILGRSSRHQRFPSLFSSNYWFHRTHGDKAQKCKQPCSWLENELACG